MYIDISLTPNETLLILTLIIITLVLLLIRLLRPHLLKRIFSPARALSISMPPVARTRALSQGALADEKINASGKRGGVSVGWSRPGKFGLRWPELSVEGGEGGSVLGKIVRGAEGVKKLHRATRLAMNEHPEDFGWDTIWLPIPTISIYTTYPSALTLISEWWNGEDTGGMPRSGNGKAVGKGITQEDRVLFNAEIESKQDFVLSPPAKTSSTQLGGVGRALSMNGQAVGELLLSPTDRGEGQNGKIGSMVVDGYFPEAEQTDVEELHGSEKSPTKAKVNGAFLGQAGIGLGVQNGGPTSISSVIDTLEDLAAEQDDTFVPTQTPSRRPSTLQIVSPLPLQRNRMSPRKSETFEADGLFATPRKSRDEGASEGLIRRSPSPGIERSLSPINASGPRSRTASIAMDGVLSPTGRRSPATVGRAGSPSGRRRNNNYLRRSSRTYRWIYGIYTNLLPTICISAMAVTVLMLAYQAGWSWYSIVRLVLAKSANTTKELANIAEAAGNATAGLVKREFVEEGVPEVDLGAMGVEPVPGYLPMQGSYIQPLVPGLTIPLSHVFPLVGTLLACQLFHEAGHVLAAAMDMILPSKFSLNLHILIPAAAVSFPSVVADLPIKSRIRIAGAGPLNNLLTWAVLGFISATRVTYLFYSDYAKEGRVVLGVSSSSPIYDHLPTGSIIEYLDDTKLAGKEDIWTQFLGGEDNDETRGWCVDKKRYLAASKAPCPDSVPVLFGLVPRNTSGKESQRCLPAYPLLTTRTWACPCTSPQQLCVKPLPSENIMRIQWRDDDTGPINALLRTEKTEPNILLWSGDRGEVWDTIRVSRWGGRGGGFLRSLIEMAELLASYISVLSLSLALLNLLPLPNLDGGHILEAILDRKYPNTNYRQADSEPSADVFRINEELNTPTRETILPQELHDYVPNSLEAIARRKVERAIFISTAAVCVASLGGGILLTALMNAYGQ